MTALEVMKRDNNVIGFTSDSCYSAIGSFVDRLMEDSKNTHDAYKRYYNEFFVFATGKDIAGVSWDDILKVNYSVIVHFREYLKKNKKNSNKTINQKVSSLLPLWRELHRHNNKVNIGSVVAEPLKVTKKRNVGSKALRVDEAFQLLDFAKEQDYKGYVKYVFYKTAIATALRKKSLLTATFDNVQQIRDEETGDMYWCIVVMDKGDEEVRPISDELYEEIMELKSPVHRINMRFEDDRIFTVSERQLVDTLADFCNEYDIVEKDRITLHSLRKTSADYANELVNGDIKQIQQQTGHKNTRVLIEDYQGTRLSLCNFPGLRMFQDQDDIGVLEELSQEELISLIKQCDGFVARQLISKLNRKDM